MVDNFIELLFSEIIFNFICEIIASLFHSLAKFFFIVSLHEIVDYLSYLHHEMKQLVGCNMLTFSTHGLFPNDEFTSKAI
jgi:hypothetical protein